MMLKVSIAKAMNLTRNRPQAIKHNQWYSKKSLLWTAVTRFKFQQIATELAKASLQEEQNQVWDPWAPLQARAL